MSYTSARATAVRMLAKYGRAMTLRSSVSSGTAWDPTITNTDTAITGVMLEYAAHELQSVGSSITATDLVQKSDKKVLTSATATPQMKLIDGGITYEIISVKPLHPGDTVIMSEIQARKT